MKFKKILSGVLASLMIVSAVFLAMPVKAENPFSDVGESNWFYESVMYAYSKGYVNGYNDGTFLPNKAMTRAELVTVLYRLEGEPDMDTADEPFDDVADNWFRYAVCWAYNNNIVKGVTETDFEPQSEITREQLVTIFHRYAEYKGVITEGVSSDIKGYDDYDAVREYARTPFGWAVATGLVNGKTETTLAPRESATRAQVAKIMKGYDEAPFEYILRYNYPKVFGKFTEPTYELINDADVYVSVDGSDENDGSFTSPVATFARAKELVRERISAGNETDEIVVAFKAGTYEAEYVEFSKADSGSADVPVKYCRYGDGEVIFTGGLTMSFDDFEAISDAEKELFADTAEDKIMKLDLTKYGFEGEDVAITVPVYEGTTQLDIARYPNKKANGLDGFITSAVTAVSEDGRSMTLIRPHANRISKYHNLEDLRLFGYLKYDWSSEDGPVLGFDAATGVITPTSNGIVEDMGPYFYLYNVPDVLDVKGEYYIDIRTDTLYVYDPSDDITLSIGGNFFSFSEVDYTTFEGLEFCYSRGDFIGANDCDNFSLLNCYIHNFRGNGISINGDNIIVRGNTFIDVGKRNVEMHSGDRNTLTHGNSIIDNNYFEHFGYTTKTNMPAVFVWGCGITISHNEMTDTPHQAICYGSPYNQHSNFITIEYNYVHNVVRQVQDAAAINACRNIAGNGSVIRYNLVTDVGGDGFRPFGVYLDDGLSGQEVYGNIFFNIAGRAFFANGGRDNKVYDNIIINNEAHDPGGFFMYSVKLRGDIEAETNGFTEPINYENEYFQILRMAPYRSEIWLEAFPNLAAAKWHDAQDETFDPNDKDFILNPSYCEVYGNKIIMTPNDIKRYSDFNSIEAVTDLLAQFGRYEQSEVFSTETNEFFANPTLGDYTVEGIEGFTDIPFKSIGRY